MRRRVLSDEEIRTHHLASQRKWKKENYERVRLKDQEYRDRHKRKKKDTRLRKQYGITLLQFEEKCKSGCEICGTLKKLVNDHDHSPNSSKPPGILCLYCNLAIGHFGDRLDSEIFQKLIAYLKVHRE